MDERRFSGVWPPARLAPIPERFRRSFRLLWLLLALTAALALVGGVWRGYVSTLEIAPRFAKLGIGTLEEDGGRWSIEYLDEAAEKAGVKDHSTLLAIDGRPVPATLSEESVSKLLVGPAGPVMLTLRAPDGHVADHRLIRNPHAEDAGGVVSDELFFAATTGAGFIGAFVTLLVGIMLVRQRMRDPVSMTLSAAFLSLVAGLPVSYPFWMWIGMIPMSDSFMLAAVLLFVVAILAFPDGRYVPRWAPWLVLGIVPVVVSSLELGLPDEAQIAVLIAYCITVAIVPVLRFRRTPAGIERQQLKWVGLGFFASVVVMAFSFGMLALTDVAWLPHALRAWIQIVGWVLVNAAILLMPLSILVAIRRYKLWDADRVIGRSAGWALLTFVAGTIWAVTTAVVEDFVKVALGASGPGFSAALSTIMALAVLGPMRTRVVGWMDAKFRARLLRLKALPSRLHVWQHADTPEDIGARVSEAIADILHVAWVAVLLHIPGGGYRSVGHVGLSDSAIRDWITSAVRDGRLTVGRIDASDAVFPLRVVLDDAGTPIGALLLGARADGSLFASDETEALAALEPDLAAALRQAQRRQVQERRIGDALAGLEARISAAEARI